MTKKLSKQQDLKKNHSTRHCLISMLEMWKRILDQRGYVCAIFVHLSKAFDTLKHNLLTTYGFETDALRYMKSYLMNRKQRVRVNKIFSEWERMTTGVPQRSTLRPLLLDIFLSNRFFLFQTPPWVTLLMTIHFTLLEIIWKSLRMFTQQFWYSKSLILQKFRGAEGKKISFHVSGEQHQNWNSFIQ